MNIYVELLNLGFHIVLYGLDAEFILSRGQMAEVDFVLSGGQCFPFLTIDTVGVGNMLRSIVCEC